MGESTNQKASLYKCLFKGCKQKTNKDGTSKYLKIKNDSRGNRKRHYLAHYPNNELKHEEKWKSAVRKMTTYSQTISSDDEIENYLNLCDSLDKLSFYRIIQQMYKRYNVTLPSSASVERLFSQGGLIFSPRRLNLTDIHFEMLLFLKVNNKIVKDSSLQKRKKPTEHLI
ncbi:hypothetical protein OUZ56_006006 [Daphnia magna]|uniref:HAT C-terminal dimerisation domain-containing protein n=1 Tax=Daphnia magna TaxID=35525 RepID=A0ABQ9YUE0_9CRUS|nr:hypothetical protein OUZ56_006006 [Daphnia magna]